MAKLNQDFGEVRDAMTGVRQIIDSHPKRVKKVRSDEFYVSGFWESYRGPLNPGPGNATDTTYYQNDLKYYDQLIYSFLTLDQKPNATHPHSTGWDGKCIYDATTQDCAENSFAWDMPNNPQKWLMEKNKALYREVKNNGKLFIFAIGGWSDSTRFLKIDQVQDFANYVVYLMGIVGDGINLDFEHMSASGNRKEQLRTMAHLIHYTRRALIEAHLKWKEITYTCKYNALYNDTNRPTNFTAFPSDGELVEIA